MQKNINVPKVSSFDELGSFAAIAVDCVPWPEQFPLKPEVTARLAHTDNALLIRFDVKENGVRAVCTEANGPVWEDDCVEFFVKDPDSKYYFNFENNCIGVGLAAKRLSRDEFEFLGETAAARIRRCASLPCQPVDIDGPQAWCLTIEIPFEVLDCPEKPETLLANFYKCGDKTKQAHFLCWNPIETVKPDFHRPEFFGKLNLEW